MGLGVLLHESTSGRPIREISQPTKRDHYRANDYGLFTTQDPLGLEPLSPGFAGVQPDSCHARAPTQYFALQGSYFVPHENKYDSQKKGRWVQLQDSQGSLRKNSKILLATMCEPVLLSATGLIRTSRAPEPHLRAYRCCTSLLNCPQVMHYEISHCSDERR